MCPIFLYFILYTIIVCIYTIHNITLHLMYLYSVHICDLKIDTFFTVIMENNTVPTYH